MPPTPTIPINEADLLSFTGNGKRIIIAGGGTGGHIFPAIAIANALTALQPTIKILFIGAKGKMEMEKVPQAGYAIKGIDIAGFNRTDVLKNIGLPYKLIKSYFQVRNIMADFIPDAVMGVGGYSSFPVLRYAQQKGIPTFIHESNSFAGKSNQLLGKKATKIFVATNGMEAFFPSGKIIITGNPVRKSIAQSTISKEEGVAAFALNPTKKIVLVTGGSLGAKGINEAIAANINKFIENDVQLIWQTGKPYTLQAKALAEGKENIFTNDFIAQMEKAYAAANIVVSRSGAMAIAELCVAKKPVVLVPFPFAAEDHQTVNAKNLVDKQAALMVKDKEANEQLVPTIMQFLNNPALQQQLAENIGKLAIVHADQQIATEVLKTIARQ
jgi:UDP-N-acetylglucosamine--N-acetylmuramyl-(pentapeptide) pyrophosphoryl-undecaprenol N-acetylglucosamine transferase